MHTLALSIAVLLLTSSPSEAPPEADGFQVPAGFEVTLYADDSLAHNIYSMTIDSKGRVVVAGPDYVKILHDDNDDGRADRASLFSPVPHSGAHGMVWDGPHLICTGDDSVLRLRDQDGNGQADDKGEVWAKLRHPEHGANGLARGPDGCFYLICGNDAGLSREQAARPGSPVKDPRCGGVARFSADGQLLDVYAHGFRNPYDIDFNAQGHLFTVDADGERDHYLPWYAPTRLFDIAQGMEHGWLLQGWQRSWNRPESFADNVERVSEIGRGSPTGLVVYRHTQFPAKYRGGVLTACWTLGRVYHIPLAPDQASYRRTPAEIFLQTTGDVGFAPVDLAVGPDGELFVAVGGRGTRGSVFRVRYAGADAVSATEECPLRRVLRAPQPQAAWSRANWAPPATELGRQAFADVATDAAADPIDQARAVEILTDLFDGLTVAEAARAVALDQPILSARVAWSLGRQVLLDRRPRESAAIQVLAKLTKDSEATVRRAAWEAIASLADFDGDALKTQPDWQGGMADDCRRARSAAILAARAWGSRRVLALLPPVDSLTSDRENLARLWLEGTLPAESEAFKAWLQVCLDVLRNSADSNVRLEAVRLIQVGLGDLRIQPDQPEVYSGYSANDVERAPATARDSIAAAVTGAFPSADTELNRELGRLAAILAPDRPQLLSAIADRWTADSLPQDDIHYLIIISRLSGQRTPDVTGQTARALVDLHAKMAARGMFPDRNWPLRVGELIGELFQRDPSLAAAIADDERFGQPAHSLFAAQMPAAARQRAARKLLAVAQSSDEDGAWTSELVSVVASLDEAEALDALRGQWPDFGLRDSLALALARHGDATDRPRMVDALLSPQPEVVTAAAEALARMKGRGDPAELAAALRALRQYGAAKEQRTVRRALANLLSVWTGETFDVEEPAAGDATEAYREWFDWFARAHPDHSAALAGLAGVDAGQWRERLAKVDWTVGEIARGQKVFEKRTCHRCHVGGGRLGPDLKGVGRRFARDDLFASIVDPNQNVAPLYQTMLVATHDGRVYHGLVVYESADGLLLQTSPDVTVRVTGAELQTARPSRQSLMPTGLLNDATDVDLADLYAYLKTLD